MHISGPYQAALWVTCHIQASVCWWRLLRRASEGLWAGGKSKSPRHNVYCWGDTCWQFRMAHRTLHSHTSIRPSLPLSEDRILRCISVNLCVW